MNTPDQCLKCRHADMSGEEALCRVQTMQHCIREGEMQKLTMEPGRCYLLNPDNNCDQFKAPLLQRLRDLL